LFFSVSDLSSSVGLCVRDYKSLRIATMTGDALVNTQAHADMQTAFDRLYY